MIGPRPTIALAECAEGLYLVEVGATAEQDQLAGSQPGGRVPERARPLELVPGWAVPDLIDVDAVGSTVVLLLDRRPPLAVSHDRGQTWSERGAGLPRGHAVAIGANPDHILVGGRTRLHISGDGGRSWRPLAVRLSGVRDIAWGRV